MKKKIANAFKNFGFIWAFLILTIKFCPYLFITFPLYLALIIRHLILIYEVFENNEDEKKDLTFKAKLITLIVNLIVMIFFSYLAFNLSPSFKAFNYSK
jgi:hypothetical protein